LPLQPDSEESIALTRKWIEDSFDTPEDYYCTVSNLPKRVVAVQNGGNPLVVHLVDFSKNQKPPKDRYICLSHCWGSQRMFKITVDTLVARTEGIFMEQLSQTFQDAIMITRRLGIKYLWIDSLCILQDSKSYWEVESAKMGQYYASSWLTIGAGLLGDGTQGCFGNRLGPEGLYCRLVVKELQQRSNLYFTTAQCNRRIEQRRINRRG
jgi:hypothetical protein